MCTTDLQSKDADAPTLSNLEIIRIADRAHLAQILHQLSGKVSQQLIETPKMAGGGSSLFAHN